MLEAGTAAPRDRAALADRLRDGTFLAVCRLPAGRGLRLRLQARLAEKVQRLPPGAALERAMLDYARLRDQARACFGR